MADFAKQMPKEKDLLPYDARSALRKGPSDRTLLPGRGIRIVTISPQDHRFGETIAKAQATVAVAGMLRTTEQPGHARESVARKPSFQLRNNKVPSVGFDTVAFTES